MTTTIRSLIAGAALVIAVCPSASAQGKSQSKGHKASPPSGSALPSTTIGPASGASPIAWLDDATLLQPGTMSLTVSAMRWSGTDVSEVDAPIADVAIGIVPRLQLGVSMARVVGSADVSGPVGGVGTSYITGKISLPTGSSSLKLAIAPMVQILGEGASAALIPGENRAQFGLPVNAEVSRGSTRVFASAGFFVHGAWFVGAGAGIQATPRVGLSASFTRAWASTSIDGLTRDRLELSGGASYLVAPQIGVYGALGQTIATTPENGAGTTISGGVTFLVDSLFKR